MEAAAADAVSTLHPAFTSFLNSGYLQSQSTLRDRLLASEWEETVRPWAARKGVADFERYVAEHGHEAGICVTWEAMQRLYANPDDLSPLGDGKARLMAQALIAQALFQSQMEVYKRCSDAAKALADVIESGKRTGASSLLGLIGRLLPLPFLK